MNTTSDARIGHIIAEETVQTVLLIIVSVFGTWLCLYRVPWQVSGAYIPDWFVIACLAVDLAIGAYVAARIRTYQRTSHIGTET